MCNCTEDSPSFGVGRCSAGQKISRAHKSRPSLHSLLTSQCSRRQIHLTQYMLRTHAHDLLFLQLRAVGSQFPFSALSFLFCLFPRINTGCTCLTVNLMLYSVEQKSIGLKFSKSQTGSDLRYSCHHNSSRFTFPIFAHSWRFSVFHSLQSITPRIY